MKPSDYAKTLILFGVVLLCALYREGGFLIVFLVPVFLVVLLYNLVRILSKPEERRRRGIRVAVWSTAMIMLFAVLSYRLAASRDDADKAVAAVLSYKARMGTYPGSLKDAGVDEEKLADQWMLRYSLKDGKPFLNYTSPAVPLDGYSYDFDSHAWQENSY